MRKTLSSMRIEESRMNKGIKIESTMKSRKRNRNSPKTRLQTLPMSQSDGEMNKRGSLFLSMRKK